MHVKAVIDMEDGTYEFTAVLSAQQHQFLIEYAIRDMMLKGMVPFHTVTSPEEAASIVTLDTPPEKGS